MQFKGAFNSSSTFLHPCDCCTEFQVALFDCLYSAAPQLCRYSQQKEPTAAGAAVAVLALSEIKLKMQLILKAMNLHYGLLLHFILLNASACHGGHAFFDTYKDPIQQRTSERAFIPEKERRPLGDVMLPNKNPGPPSSGGMIINISGHNAGRPDRVYVFCCH